MKKLKIGLLTEIINGHSGSRAPLEIGKHLSMLGHDVTIYAYNTMQDIKTREILEKKAVKIVTLTQNNTPLIGKYISAVNLFRILQKDSPQVLTFSGTPPFFLAGKLSGIPIIRIYQGVQMDAYLEKKIPGEKITTIETVLNKLANIIIYLIDYMSFKLSDGVIAISKYSKQEGETFYHRNVDAVIYHGTTPLPKSKNRSHRSIEIISVSRLTPYKGFHLIVEALKDINTKKKIRFTIIGSQPKKNYIKYLKRIGEKNIRIVVNPNDRELARMYQNSDIYAAADRYLYFGLPIMEAAQFGVPSVSLDLAAAKEVIYHNKTGYVAKNMKEFSTYLKILIEDEEIRKTMGENAKLRAKYFSWKKCAKQYEKIIQKTLH